MTTDLYSADLRTISGNDVYKAIIEFLRLDLPKEDRPREGYLLDFKEELSDRFLHSVAAFANTFGGLLIVGVKEDDGRPREIVGVIAKGELKTQVASLIASNLFPGPPFDIAEADIPNNADRKKVCVVRIRETSEICLLAKKGEKHPIYVRIEDQSAPADAAQVRSLLNRKRRDADSGQDFNQGMNDFGNQLYVCTYAQNARGTRSNTGLQILACPFTYPPMHLDTAAEKTFGGLVAEINPGLDELSKMTRATVDFLRSRDWTEIRFRESDHDYERRWRLTSRGDIGFITQVRWPVTTPTGGVQNVWTLYDVVLDLIRLATLAKKFWSTGSYYGAFRLEASLGVEELGNAPRFEPLFYALTGGVPDFSLDSRPIILRKNNTPPVMEISSSALDLDYTSLNESLPNVIAIVINQLLRGLGHLADLKGLEQSIRSLFFPPDLMTYLAH